MKFRVVHQPSANHARSSYRIIEQTTGRQVDWINRYLDHECLRRVADLTLRSYPANETEVIKDRLKPKRVFVSLGTPTWAAAESEVARLYDRGSLPSAAAAAKSIDNSAVTVKHAGDRFLTSLTDGSLNPVEIDTYQRYRSLIHDRLLPYCTEKDITYIREFENQDVCSQFTESWQQMRCNVGELLAMSTCKNHVAAGSRNCRRTSGKACRGISSGPRARVAKLRRR